MAEITSKDKSSEGDIARERSNEAWVLRDTNCCQRSELRTSGRDKSEAPFRNRLKHLAGCGIQIRQCHIQCGLSLRIIRFGFDGGALLGNHVQKP